MTVGATPTPAVIRPQALAACSLRRPPEAWDPARIRALHDSVVSRAEGLHRRLVDQKEAECTVLGYATALRAVALLFRAGASTAVSCPPSPMGRPPRRVAACPRLTSGDCYGGGGRGAA
jgi:hypothetical protein